MIEESNDNPKVTQHRENELYIFANMKKKFLCEIIVSLKVGCFGSFCGGEINSSLESAEKMGNSRWMVEWLHMLRINKIPDCM